MPFAQFESASAGIVAERSCERAVMDFTAAFDVNDVEGMARVFTEDGVWKRQDGNIVGIVQLREMLAKRPAGQFVRHVLSNVRTTFVSATQAIVESYVTVYRHDFSGKPQPPSPNTVPNLLGRYRDELRLVGGQWKLAGREVAVDFKQQKTEPAK